MVSSDKRHVLRPLDRQLRRRSGNCNDHAVDRGDDQTAVLVARGALAGVTVGVSVSDSADLERLGLEPQQRVYVVPLRARTFGHVRPLVERGEPAAVAGR